MIRTGRVQTLREEGKLDAGTGCAYLFMLESAPRPHWATLLFSLRAAKNPTANPESRFLARFLLHLYCVGGRRDILLPSRPDLPLKRQHFFIFWCVVFFCFFFSVCKGVGKHPSCSTMRLELKNRTIFLPPIDPSMFLILDASRAELHS